jgi:hypothetical protein
MIRFRLLMDLFESLKEVLILFDQTFFLEVKVLILHRNLILLFCERVHCLLQVHDLELEVVFFAQTLCHAILDLNQFLLPLLQVKDLLVVLLLYSTHTQHVQIAQFVDPECHNVWIEDNIVVRATPCHFLPHETPLPGNSSRGLFLLLFFTATSFLDWRCILVQCFVGFLVDEPDDLLLVIADLALAQHYNLVLELQELFDQLIAFALQLGYIETDLLLNLRPYCFLQS